MVRLTLDASNTLVVTFHRRTSEPVATRKAIAKPAEGSGWGERSKGFSARRRRVGMISGAFVDVSLGKHSLRWANGYRVLPDDTVIHGPKTPHHAV